LWDQHEAYLNNLEQEKRKQDSRFRQFLLEEAKSFQKREIEEAIQQDKEQRELARQEEDKARVKRREVMRSGASSATTRTLSEATPKQVDGQTRYQLNPLNKGVHPQTGKPVGVW